MKNIDRLYLSNITNNHITIKYITNIICIKIIFYQNIVLFISYKLIEFIILLLITATDWN